MNAHIHADYEPIHTLFHSHGQNPFTSDAFPRIRESLAATGLNITGLTIHGDFHKYLSASDQSALRTLDLDTRPATSPGIQDLIIGTLTCLFENPDIDTHIIITNSPDIIPLLKTIRYQNKRSHLITTQNGYHQSAAQAADIHITLEDLLPLPNRSHPGRDAFETLIAVDPDTVTLARMARAHGAARYFLQSHLLEQLKAQRRPVCLKSYLEVFAATTNRSPGEVLDDFRLAHELKYVTIYQDPEWGLCLREGEEKKRVKFEG